jgi:outer membrane protein W
MMENENMRFNEFVDKLKFGESKAPDAVWEKIEATLNQGRKKKALYLWSVSLAITFLIAGTSALFWLSSSEKPSATANFVAKDRFSNSKQTDSSSDLMIKTNQESLFPKDSEKNQITSTINPNKTSIEALSIENASVLKIKSEKPKSNGLENNYTPTPEELANQEKFAHNKVHPIVTLLPIKEAESQIVDNNLIPVSGAFTQEQLNQEYRLFSVYAGYGIFDQNLIMANPHADTVSFRAEKGHQFNIGIQYNLSKNWALDFNFGRSSNDWSSAARLIVEEETASGGIDPHVYLSTNFQFNEVTNQNDVQEILNENPGKEEIRLVHQMKYTHYRLGFSYSINDFKHWDFRAILQAEYMQLRDVSTFFQAGDHSISYPVSGFKKGIWALRPGINIAYKLNDSFSIYTEGSTSVRGTYLMKHPNWKIYENQFGLFCGLRYSW